MANNGNLMIAVMGATGTGKSTFVNMVSGSNFQTGSSLLSCTQDVQVTAPFNCLGRTVTLIDTPGFDDSVKTDTEILQTISNYLAQSYRNNQKLCGVIYVHRISDFRMSGISRRNFGMFRNLCGDNTLNNVVVVTNMWGEVTPEVGQARERELSTNPSLFKPVLDKGAKMLRHTNSLESAQNILRSFLDKYPVTLQIQHEVINEGKHVSQTAAAAIIEEQKNRELEEQRRRYEEQLRREREIAEAQAREREAQRQREIEAARLAHEAEVRRQAEERARHEAWLAEQRRQEAIRMEEMQRQLREQEAARRAQEEQARRVQQQLEEQARQAAAEHQRIQEELERARAVSMSRQSSGSSDGGCIIF